MRKKNLPPKNNSEENRSQVYPEPVERAFNYSLKYLSYRDRSVKEVYDYLLRKNFIGDIIESLLKEAQDDFETARILFDKKKKTLGKLPPDQFKKKMGGFLQRKGFSFEVITKLLRKANV